FRATHIIRATEAVRELSNLRSKVYYQGESFEIKRGKEVVAKLSPAMPTQKMHLSELKAFLSSLPALDKEDQTAFIKDTHGIRTTMKVPVNKWG
ncbi:MAG: hypothetical protein IBJ00_05560, partial [Alphaproteobacteria bacterium]|nr:hypothetical protein [Alphaproteobacteria bacterium]